MCRPSELTPLQFLFLLVLNKREEGMSGSEVVTELEEDLGREWTPSPGATYKVLQALEAEGFVRKRPADERDRRIKRYGITPLGKEMLLDVARQELRYLQFMRRCCGPMMPSSRNSL